MRACPLVFVPGAVNDYYSISLLLFPPCGDFSGQIGILCSTRAPNYAVLSKPPETSRRKHYHSGLRDPSIILLFTHDGMGEREYGGCRTIGPDEALCTCSDSSLLVTLSFCSLQNGATSTL